MSQTAPSTKTFLIQVKDSSVRGELEQLIMTSISEVEVLDKMPTPAPRVIVTDDTKIEPVMNDASFGHTALVVLSKIPGEDQFLDDFVTNKLQVLNSLKDEDAASEVFNKALKFSFEFGRAEFKIRNLVFDEVLFNRGDHAGHVYLLRKGKLRAFLPDNPVKTLGLIQPGDFVGEMAYFNLEPRIASVAAVEPSELIEIPIHNFEAVLMQKPLWCKKLLQTMSQRLKSQVKTDTK
ncbi:MAG: cyclic nucleotide-binding domain-containing protein [Bdellovibrionales bacterium]|nr:cyclic nucleotide-binding domain-containing protein [Bdellovibrionales bacterium]